MVDSIRQYLSWYGFLFSLGLALVWVLMRIAAIARADVSRYFVDRLMLWISIGVVFGGRLGYVVLYEPEEFLAHPVRILSLDAGGMSFHGGLIGASLAVFLLGRASGYSLWALADIASSSAPIGLLCGRIGNFMNGEMYGPPTTLPWGVVFPSPGPERRHPTQLYEMLTEGVLLLVLLYPLNFSSWSRRHLGSLFGLFLIFYALVRIAIEPLRADNWNYQLAGVAVTAGQIYSLPMIAVGLVILGRSLSAARLRDRV
ncbi:prolipoprotein diacylglyceryl transferase [Rhizobium leguminosarum]|uniref:prolipoprotein diacylglyceryl transferase n=1 Tax=Rhizobium leguminosarum TaxID=384 RepID=UPI003ED07635